jgi:hypothetical protein
MQRTWAIFKTCWTPSIALRDSKILIFLNEERYGRVCEYLDNWKEVFPVEIVASYKQAQFSSQSDLSHNLHLEELG